MAALLLAAAFTPQGPATGDWSALDAQAAQLYDQGDLPKAIEVAQRALLMAASPRESGRSLDRLGFLLYTSGNLPDGEKYLRQSLDLRQTVFGADSLEYAETANDLAMLLRDVRKLDEATTLAQRAVSIRQAALGDADLRVAESLNTLGTVHGFTGDYTTAVSNFERALAIHEQRTPSDRSNEEYGTLCINAAGTYQRLGKYELSEITFTKGLDALRIKPGVKHPAYATSVLALAALKVDLGRYTEAERLYEEGGRLVKSELGEEHPVYATFLNNRGFLFYSIGDAVAAEADYERSLELKKKLYGAASPQALSTLRNLAHLTYTQNHEAGERLLADAVGIYANAATAPPFDYTSVLLGLGRAKRDRGALDEARAAVQRATTVAERGLGVHHPLYAAAVRDLGVIEADGGNTAEAERLLREAVMIAEQAHGPDHPDLTAFLEPLARHHVHQQNFAAAVPLYRRSVDIQDRFLSSVLEIGSERAKTDAITASAGLVPALIALQAKASNTLPETRTLAFEAVTQRKGRVLEQVRNWRQHLRENGSDQVRRELDQWQAILDCRTSLSLALGYRDLKPSIIGGCTLAGTGFEGRYERLLSDLRTRWSSDVADQAMRAIAELTVGGDRIEAALNREVGGAYVGARRASAEDIRRRLAGDELLIEFVSYDEVDRADADRQRYGAFVLDSTGKLEWSDIGPAAPIDSSVRDLLAAANDWSVSVHNHENQSAQSASETARDAIANLSRRVWDPLGRIVDAKRSVRHLRIAPDAMLNLVPFEALNDGQDLIERFAVSYLPAGRDLAAMAPSDRPGAAPIVVVSPGASAAPHRTNEPVSRTFRADGLAHLPVAAREASDFRRIVPHSELYATANATERRVKALHGPSLLHIVGHGIIGSRQDCVERSCSSAGLDASSRAMTLSAIVLEEAYGRGGTSTDDGMLTALELENIDLRGTEMLVLSQCQMASGAPSVGEGVYGMRRAAAIAGARTFVAPFWNIDDRVQRTLMDHFYTALAASQSRDEALRQAKLALRASPATADFLLWAPVILSGSVSPLPASLFEK
ncbi:MAG TPA: CHAT domain-containing tetratricopeptide repeat protein [Vicinamibacterales bacterium]|nr:CHAT domain-containing tetratricopeptide repeat protein [Vicinamibacterales bacterium]